MLISVPGLRFIDWIVIDGRESQWTVNITGYYSVCIWLLSVAAVLYSYCSIESGGEGRIPKGLMCIPHVVQQQKYYYGS